MHLRETVMSCWGYGLTFQKRKGACLKTQANDLMHNKTEKPPRKMNMGPQMHKLCCHTRHSGDLLTGFETFKTKTAKGELISESFSL